MSNKKIVFKTELDSKKSVKSLLKLEDELTKMKDSLRQIPDVTSKAFKDLSREIATADSKVKNLNKSFEGLDTDAKAGEMGKLAGGLGAVGTAAAVAFAGNENAEKFFKTFATGLAVTNAVKGGIEAYTASQKLLKPILQSSAVAQGILNGIMEANPIGLIIVGVAALAGGLYLLNDAINSVATAQEVLNDIQNETAGAVGEEISKLEDLTNVLENENTTRFQKAEALKKLNADYPELLGNITLEQVGTEEYNTALAQNIKFLDLQAQAKALAALKAESYKKLNEERVAVQTGENKSIWTYITASVAHIDIDKLANLQSQQTIIKEQKKIDVTNELSKSINEQIGVITKKSDTESEASKAAEKASKLADEQEKKSAENHKKWLARQTEKKKIEDEAALLKANTINKIIELENKAEDSLLSSTEREKNIIYDKYFSLIEAAKQYGLDTTQLELDRQTAIDEIERNAKQKHLELEKSFADQALQQGLDLKQARLDAGLNDPDATIEDLQAATEERLSFEQEQYDAAIELENERELVKGETEANRTSNLEVLKQTHIDKMVSIEDTGAKAEQRIKDAKVAAAFGAADSIMSIGNSISSLAGENVALQKTLAISSIALDTAKGIAGAVSAGADMPYPTNIPAILSGVSAVLSGIASAKKALSAAKIPGGGGGGGSIGGGGAPSFSPIPLPPPIPQDLIPGDNQGNTDTIGSGAGLNQQGPLKAYIVETEITAKQKDISLIEDASKFG